ncbi:hypothetical protein HYFRA_00001271 [Hymenoscyphus fraxineus]|uniref:S-adenosyl-L-methionine-dependent methyltransferase n=1 Tax=Hymenoscyphus fraxineus TaxID=746836 RepID=A0A9N9L796_9HELO|nr:hypothetical protein HYFRA_00001271 [Hymenoscyphus fraxineus]
MSLGKQKTRSISDDSLTLETSDIPVLEVDDDCEMGNVQSDDADEGGEESHYGPFRGRDSRTLYHQPRSDQDTLNSTQSLYDSDITYFMIHGRRYCKDYFMPNDEEEQTRTQILHTVYLYLLDQKLTTIELEDPTKILDVGTGSGEWAMAMGDEYPTAEIIGIDIAKIQPSAVPLNVFFEIDDAEEEGGWTWPDNEFDLVHFRTMAGAFKSWDEMYAQAFKHLKPGGWIEVIDFDNHKKLLSYFDKGSSVHKWVTAIKEAARISGRDRNGKHLEPERLEALGFVEVSAQTRYLPLGIWPEDPEANRIGKHNLVAQLSGLEAVSLRLLTEVMGWDPAEVRRVCKVVDEAFRKLALDPVEGHGLGAGVRILVGRKPDKPDASNDTTPVNGAVS